MAHCSTVLNQIVRHLPRFRFEQFVREHGGDRRVRDFSCWKLFLSQIYAQLSGVDSLRDLETSLRSKVRWLYLVGLDKFSRSTMADAGENARRLIDGIGQTGLTAFDSSWHSKRQEWGNLLCKEGPPRFIPL